MVNTRSGSKEGLDAIATSEADTHGEERTMEEAYKPKNSAGGVIDAAVASLIENDMAGLTQFGPRQTLLERWSRMVKLTPFRGGSTAEAAEWLRTTKNQLQALEVPRALWLQMAVTALQGDAVVWWNRGGVSIREDFSVLESRLREYYNILDESDEAALLRRELRAWKSSNFRAYMELIDRIRMLSDCKEDHLIWEVAESLPPEYRIRIDSAGHSRLAPMLTYINTMYKVQRIPFYSAPYKAAPVHRIHAMERDRFSEARDRTRRKEPQVRRKLICYHCGKEGHFKRDCPSLKEGAGQGNE